MHFGKVMVWIVNLKTMFLSIILYFINFWDQLNYKNLPMKLYMHLPKFYPQCSLELSIFVYCKYIQVSYKSYISLKPVSQRGSVNKTFRISLECTFDRNIIDNNVGGCCFCSLSEIYKRQNSYPSFGISFIKFISFLFFFL